MALDAASLRVIREWVGSQPDDDALDDAFDDAGTLNGAALSILRQRRADLLVGKAWGVPGDYYEGAANLSALDRQIADLEALVGTGAGVLTVGSITRDRGAR